MKDCTEILGVWSEYWTKIPWYDDGYGPLWVARNTFGVAMVIRAPTWHDAWEIWEDETPPIPPEEVPEAYGFYGPNAAKDLEAAVEGGEFPDLVEGYSYQANATGTGIVAHDLNGESLDELSPALWRKLGLKIDIGRV